MITRDAVQGFLDGLKATGTDMSNVDSVVELWLKNHPTYPQDEEALRKVLSDLGSYRK